MRMRLSYLLLLSSVSAAADTIYKQTDNNGNIVYTDTPQKNTQTIIIPSETTPSISSAPAAPPAHTSAVIGAPTPATGDTATETRVTYTTFALISPADQETFQNQRLIPVKVLIEPKLQTGDKTQLYVDGKPYGDPAEGSDLTVNQLDRGSHTLSAVIVDTGNLILKSTNTITINVQYARLGSAVP
jgi:hypothetical protein